MPRATERRRSWHAPLFLEDIRLGVELKAGIGQTEPARQLPGGDEHAPRACVSSARSIGSAHQLVFGAAARPCARRVQLSPRRTPPSPRAPGRAESRPPSRPPGPGTRRRAAKTGDALRRVSPPAISAVAAVASSIASSSIRVAGANHSSTSDHADQQIGRRRDAVAAPHRVSRSSTRACASAFSRVRPHLVGLGHEHPARSAALTKSSTVAARSSVVGARALSRPSPPRSNVSRTRQRHAR